MAILQDNATEPVPDDDSGNEDATELVCFAAETPGPAIIAQQLVTTAGDIDPPPVTDPVRAPAVASALHTMLWDFPVEREAHSSIPDEARSGEAEQPPPLADRAPYDEALLASSGTSLPEDAFNELQRSLHQTLPNASRRSTRSSWQERLLRAADVASAHQPRTKVDVGETPEQKWQAATLTPRHRVGNLPIVLVALGVVGGGSVITLTSINLTGKRAEAAPASLASAPIANTALPGGMTQPRSTVIPTPPERGGLGPVASAPAGTAIHNRPIDTRTAGSSTSNGSTTAQRKPTAAPPSNTVRSTTSPPAVARGDDAPSEAAPAGAERVEEATEVTRPVDSVTLPVAPPAQTQTISEPAMPAGAPLEPTRPAAVATASVPQRTAPRLIAGGQPGYPNMLRANRVSGTVEVRLTIDETGRVTRVQALSGPGPLRGVVEQAVRQWRYQPATINGAPTASETAVSFRFDPSKREE